VLLAKESGFSPETLLTWTKQQLRLLQYVVKENAERQNQATKKALEESRAQAQTRGGVRRKS
jgi:hypothetical protein